MESSRGNDEGMTIINTGPNDWYKWSDLMKAVTQNFIDQFGIKNANEKVLTDSISDIYTGNEIVYVDHFKINDFKSISVVRGEDNCRAIALASIVAKVLRDNLMIKFSEKYPEYSFEKNKGYGTKEHRQAISKYGLSNIHRKSFSLKPI